MLKDLRPFFRQEPFQRGYVPNLTAINAIKAILLGTVEGRFKLDECDHFFPDVSWDWIDDTIADAEDIMDELILRGFVWEAVWPEHDDCSTFGLTTEGEIWTSDHLGAPQDFDPDDPESIEFLIGLDVIRKTDPRAADLPLVAKPQPQPKPPKPPKTSEWLQQETYTAEDAAAALDRARQGFEDGLLSSQGFGQIKRRINERTIA